MSNQDLEHRLTEEEKEEVLRETVKEIWKKHVCKRYESLINDPDHEIREGATDVLALLAQIDSDLYQELIKKALSDGDSCVQFAALRSSKPLAEINPPLYEELDKIARSDYGENTNPWLKAEAEAYISGEIVNELNRESEEFKLLENIVNSSHKKSKEQLLDYMRELIQIEGNKTLTIKINEYLASGLSLEEADECARVEVPGYKIQRKLGQGAFKACYSGIHIDTGIEHAVKIVNVSPRGKKILALKGITEEELYKNEARRAATIAELGSAHNVPGLQAYRFSYTGGDHFIIIEKKLLKGLNEELGSVPQEYRITLKRLDYLAFLLRKLHNLPRPDGKVGFNHGDLSLSNVMIDEQEWVYFTDLGITSLLCDAASIDYRAPELFPYEDGLKKVDSLGPDIEALKKADVWSYGACAFTLLTGGAPPFEINTPKPEPDEFDSYDDYAKARERYEKEVYDAILNTPGGYHGERISKLARTMDMMEGRMHDPDKRYNNLLYVGFFKKVLDMTLKINPAERSSMEEISDLFID